MNVELATFIIFSALLIFTSVKVSAINLVFSFFYLQFYGYLLGAEFLSIILILVYVGTVMVLFVVVMMLDINIARKSAAYVKYLPIGLGIFIVFNILIIYFCKYL